MEVYRFRELPGAPEPSVVTIGVFDGVHRGHLRVFERALAAREDKNLERTWAVTFDRHPLEVLHPEASPPLLTTLDERIGLLESLELDGVLVLEFTRELAELDYETFLRRYVLDGLSMRHLVVGYDFHFGKGRRGTPETLAALSRSWGFGLDVVTALREERTIISSTTVRKLVVEGRMKEASLLLGRAYSFRGRVVEGSGRGHELGYPTANLEAVDSRKLLPGRGVYAVRVAWKDGVRGGMLNVGTAPTMGRGVVVPEVHVFDWEGDLYRQELEVSCLQYLRPEEAFPSPRALARRLALDETETRRILAAEDG
jgi:riboflavin kinase/FMN adenylyltransferase